MSRIKACSAALLLAAMVSFSVPNAHAQTLEVITSGSSAMWETLALAAWNCTAAGAVPPCAHYTNKTAFGLADVRPTLNGYTGNVNFDQGPIWIVWDSTTVAHNGPKVWAFVKVDSVVGDRCFLAQPQCYINTNGAAFPPAGPSAISFVWGPDSNPPASVSALFTGTGAAGTQVNAASTDIRPEDAGFAICRVNSAAGQATGTPVNGFDTTDGLGYNSTNAAGKCAPLSGTLAQLVGSPILSGVGTGQANVLAFSQPAGKDPFTGTTVPAIDTVDVGADPVVFIYGNAGGQLTGLSNATPAQLQTVFSGGNCDAGALGLSNAGIQVYLREPESGTMNTTEATVFRFPVLTKKVGHVYDAVVNGVSQELGVNGAAPLNPTNVPCPSSDSKGGRWRAIGTSQEISSVQNSDGAGNNWGTKTDGIGYAFNGFANFSAIAGNAAYGYITVDGIDPIFSSHPANNELPACTYPCSEASIWGSSGTSYPNVRNGTYGAFSVLRMITTAAHNTIVKDLVTASHSFVVTSIPDYIPAQAAAGDPGLLIWRSHYQQWDGTGVAIGAAAGNGSFTGGGNPNTGDKGGDMGGCVLTLGATDRTTTKYVQSSFGQTDTPAHGGNCGTGTTNERVD